MGVSIADYFKNKYLPVLEKFIEMSESKSDDDREKSIYTLKSEVCSDFDVVKMKILSRRILSEEIPCIEEMCRMINVFEEFTRGKNLNFAGEMLLSRLNRIKAEFGPGYRKKKLLAILKEEATSLYDTSKGDSGSYKWKEFRALVKKEASFNRVLEHELKLVNSAEEMLVKGARIVPDSRMVAFLRRRVKFAMTGMACVLVALTLAACGTSSLVRQGEWREAKTPARKPVVFLDSSWYKPPAELAPILKDIPLYAELRKEGVPLRFEVDDSLRNEENAYALFQGNFLSIGGTIYYSHPKKIGFVPGEIDTLKSSMYHELVHARQNLMLKIYFKGEKGAIPEWKMKFYYASFTDTSGTYGYIGAEMEAYYYELLFEKEKFGIFDESTYANFISYYLQILKSGAYSKYGEIRKLTEEYYKKLVQVTGQTWREFYQREKEKYAAN